MSNNKMQLTWKEKGPVLSAINIGELSENLRIMVFDLDHTLIVPTEKKKNRGAPYKKWRFFKNAKELVQKEAAKPNTLIVIISNQANLANYKPAFIEKVTEVIEQLGVPLIFYAAGKYNIYRKPNTGIISHALIPLLEEKGVKKITHFQYVGDAAGRENDFSDADRKFLMNVQLYLKSKANPIPSVTPTFKTPEQFFLGEDDEPFTLSGFDPKKTLDEARRVPGSKKKMRVSELDTSIDYLEPEHDDQEVIILVGPPASGKSSLAARMLDEWDNYKRVSGDYLKTKEKVNRKMGEYLREGYSVIIDKTNPDVDTRAEHIKAAQHFFKRTGKPVHIRAIFMNGDWPAKKRREFAEHMNIVRQRLKGNKRIPPHAYHRYYKNFSPPSEKEGFTQVLNAKFVPRFTKPGHLLAFLQRSRR